MSAAMNGLVQDVRQGLRSLRRSPLVVAMAVLCLGVGIGLTTFVFSIINAVILEGLPFAQADRLFTVTQGRAELPEQQESPSYSVFVAWKAAGTPGIELAAFRPRSVAVAVTGSAERQQAVLASNELLPLLGLRPVAGRSFNAEDDRPGAQPVAMINESAWRQQFDGRTDAIGRVILVNGTPHVLVGVVPRLSHPAVPGAFRSARVWLPLGSLSRSVAEAAGSVRVIARFGSNASAPPAVPTVEAMIRTLEARHPDLDRWAVSMQPLNSPVSGTTRALLAIMMAAGAAVLVIACGNVANLLLARTAQREREIAIRRALGATRAQICRQVLAESALLGMMSMPVGVFMASLCLRLLLRSPSGDAVNLIVPMNAHVLGFAGALSVGVSLAFGLIPAIQATRGATEVGLASGAAAAYGQRRHRATRATLIVTEIAISLILMVSGALFARSFYSLLNVPTVVDTENLLSLRVERVADTPRGAGGPTISGYGILERLRAIPGVEAAGIATLLPIRGGGERSTVETFAAPTDRAPAVLYAGVSDGFFAALRAPLLQGREFNESEASEHAAVAIINHRAALRLWQDAEPLGQQFRLAADTSGTWFTVIGVAPDLPNWDVSDRPQPTVYLPLGFVAVDDPNVFIRSATALESIMQSVRREVGAVDGRLVIFDLQTMTDVHRQAFWRQGTMGTAFGMFAILSLLLAVVGLYGVLSYMVVQRRREMGVRLALGADGTRIVRMVVTDGMRLVALGVGIGLPLALAVARLLQSRLVGVRYTDPVSLGGVLAIMIGVAMIASYVPAARAARTDPIRVLRE